MRNLSNIIFLILSISLSAFGQDFGFFGKKNVVSFHSTGNMRVLSGVSIPIIDKDRNGYKINRYTSTNKYNETSKLFRYDLRASYKRVVSRQMAVGFEFGYEKFRLPSIDAMSYSEYANISSLISAPTFNNFSYLLVVELFGDGSIAPVGVSSSFGIGPKFYAFDFNENYRYSQSTEMVNVFPEYDNNMMSIELFWDLTYRVPINHVIAFDLGLRIRSGFLLKRSTTSKEGIIDRGEFYSSSGATLNEDNYEWTKSNLRNRLNTENLGNVFNLKAGLSFIL